MIRNLSGRFYRIVFAHDLERALSGAVSPEGRFHHDGQPALYASPTPEAAAAAVATYVRPDDPPRIILPLGITGANVFDIRKSGARTRLGLAGPEPSVPWQPERAAGRPATSWIASDAARGRGADGMIYASRKRPSRWHLVLFRWNGTGGPAVVADGAAIPFMGATPG